MAFYQLPKIIGRDNKPPFGARINWHHHLSQGLVGAWLFNEAGGTKVVDSVNGMNGIFARDTGNYPVWGAYTETLVDFSNTTTGLINVPHSNLQNPSSLSLFIKFIVINDGTLDLISKGGNEGYRLSLYTGVRRPIFLDRGPGTNYVYYNYDVPINTILSMSASVDASGLSLYYNGALVASNSTAFGGNISSNNLIFGAQDITGSAHLVGQIFCVYLFNRRLTPDEHFLLHTNPYQMFWPTVWDAYFVPAAAPPPTGGKSIFGYDSIFHAGGIIQT